MNRLFSSLSNCSSSPNSVNDNNRNSEPNSVDEIDTDIDVAESLCVLLCTLADKGSDQNLIVEPLYSYLESSK